MGLVDIRLVVVGRWRISFRYCRMRSDGCKSLVCHRSFYILGGVLGIWISCLFYFIWEWIFFTTESAEEERRQKLCRTCGKVHSSLYPELSSTLSGVEGPSSFFLLPSSFFLLPSSFFLQNVKTVRITSPLCMASKA